MQGRVVQISEQAYQVSVMKPVSLMWGGLEQQGLAQMSASRLIESMHVEDMHSTQWLTHDYLLTIWSISSSYFAYVSGQRCIQQLHMNQPQASLRKSPLLPSFGQLVHSITH